MTAELAPLLVPPHAITFWVIYHHPKDWPHCFVLRPQFVVRLDDVPNAEDYGVITYREGRTVTIASRAAWLRPTLEECRALVPPGCHPFADDDPLIAEVWMQ